MTNDQEEAYEAFHQYVRYWWETLEDMIVEIVSQGSVPVLVTLSRRMPRFLNWFRHNFAAESEIKIDTSILDSVEIVTELALPFLFFEDYKKERSYVLIDDVIIHGTTLKTVADSLYLLTDSPCRVSCLFMHERAMMPSTVYRDDFDMIPYAEGKLAEDFIAIISEKIAERELPIDLEFPIFKIDMRGFHSSNGNTPVDNAAIRIRNNANDNGLSCYDVEGANEVFSIDIDAALSKSDFSKIRFYNRGDRLIFNVFNPHVIAERDLRMKTYIFSNPLYQEIWKKSTSVIRSFLREPLPDSDAAGWKNVKTNFYHSLCVWANYLLSISLLNDYKDVIFPEEYRYRIRLNTEDLYLLIGRNVARHLKYELETLIAGGYINDYEREATHDVPIRFAPRSFEDDYIQTVGLSAILEESPEEVLMTMFDYQHYDNDEFKHSVKVHERLNFGETHMSMWEALQPFFMEEEDRASLHSWVDAGIDHGYVVPKYERVLTEGNVPYWRRYFHAGLRKFKNR